MRTSMPKIMLVGYSMPIHQSCNGVFLDVLLFMFEAM